MIIMSSSHLSVSPHQDEATSAWRSYGPLDGDGVAVLVVLEPLFRVE